MKKSLPLSSTETQWTRGAQWTLAAAMLFILLNLAQVAYRFTIPSLGWAEQGPDSLGTPYFELEINAVGAPSALQPGDHVSEIDHIPAQHILNNPLKPLAFSNWRVGETIPVTVEREGKTLVLEAPLVHWTLSAWWRTNFGQFEGILGWLVTLLLAGVSTFTFFQRPANLSARFLFAFGLANLSITLSNSIPDAVAFYFNVPAAFATAFFSNIVFAYLFGPSFLGFALTFPKPKALIQRQSRWLLLPYLIGSLTVVLLVVAPVLATIGFFLTFAMLLLGVAALVHSGFTMRDAISRAQLRWAIGGVVTGIAVFMLNFASNVPSPYREIILFSASLGLPIIVFSLAMAILRYRLFDIDIIIRRTLQYTLLSGLLALTYFGGIVILQGLLGPLTGETNSPLVTVISTLAVAALFNPLRIRVQDFIDHRFYRRKYNAEQALARFAATARDEVEMEKLTSELLRVLDETMQPESVILWLKTAKKKGFYE